MISNPVSRSGVVDRWLVAGLYERRVEYGAVRIEGCDRYLDWWVDPEAPVYENPSRSRFTASRRSIEVEAIDVRRASPGRQLRFGDQERDWTYYIPFAHPWIDHSGFWSLPTHVVEWATTTVVAKVGHTAAFRVSTAGRVKAWLNGVPVVDFSPFRRNQPESLVLSVGLLAGVNHWLVYHEDLAERDTRFDFRVEYLGDAALRTVLPTGAARPSELRAVEASLRDARFDQDTACQGNVVLRIANPLPRALHATVRWWREWDRTHEAGLDLAPAADSLDLGPVQAFGDAILTFEITLAVGPISLQRRLLLQTYPVAVPSACGGIAERRRLVLEMVAQRGVDDLHKAHAMLRSGVDPEAVAPIVRAETRRIMDRRDCSDFALIGAFRLWSEYRNGGVMPEDVWQGLQAAILGYRYWCDEPGDDVMWFFSENHALLFHAAELLAGQLFPDEVFPNDGVRGRSHYERGRRRLEAWFGRHGDLGIAEWNSSAYIPIDLMGLLTLYDLADDGSVRMRARQALDATFTHLAAASVGGVLASTQGRTYERELKGDRCNALSCVNWIAFGQGYPNTAPHGSVSLALSSYSVPASALELERSLRGRSAIYQIHQGPPGHANLYTYRTGASSLASAVHYRPGSRGYQEHVVHAFLGPDASVWINHPGELALTGSGRPSYWAGNGSLPDVVQYRDLAILTYCIPDADEIGFTHAHFPASAFDEAVEDRSGWWIGRRGDGFVGLRARNGLRPARQGPNYGRELVSPGRRNVWLVRLAARHEFEDLRAFWAALQHVRVRVGPDLSVEVRDPIYGTVRTRWNGSLSVDGRRLPTGDAAYPVSGLVELVEP